MSRDACLRRILDVGIIAVVRAPEPAHLVEVIRALAEGGVTVAEVTFTVPGALDVIQQARRELPENILLGAGTVLDAETARAAILAGAQFIVAPTLNLDVIRLCHRYDKLAMPGAFTPTEILSAWEAGADIVKVFPADSLGPEFFKAMRGPLPQVRLMPTGGVDLNTAAHFIKAGACALGIGSQLVEPKAVANRDFGRLRDLARQYVSIVKQARPEPFDAGRGLCRVSALEKPMESMITTFGEAMIRLAPPNFRRLEQTDVFDVEVGGAELNTAVGLARLGRPAAWLTRLTDNALGRIIANRAREAGVRTSDILWTDADRVGVYFLEMGAAPRPSRIIYDRAGSAMAQIAPGMIEWKTVFESSKWFYVSGITPALSAAAAAATLEALRSAKAHGATTFVDPNYRAKLWTVEQAAAWLGDAIPYIDVLISNPEDMERFFKVQSADIERAAAAAVEKLQIKAIALTLRQVHSVWNNAVTAIAFQDGKLYRTQSYNVEIVDRLGSGDAFVSGFIDGFIDGDLQRGLDFGVALNAIKHTVPGDFVWTTKEEVDSLVKGGGLRISR